MKLIIEEAVSNVVEVQKTVTNLTIAPFDIGLKKLIQVSDSRTISLSDDLTLTDSDYTVQFIDPGGADRNIALPSVGSGNHAFFIVNTADADENLNIKSGSTTLETLAQGQSAMFISNGATWILWRSIPSDYQDGLDGWNLVSDTWSYSASNKITVPSGAQSKYPNYCKIRWKQGGAFKYAYAKATSDTELTIYAGSDYSVANSAITDVYYSVSECPLGFPEQFNWNPTYAGFSTDPTNTCSRFSIIGKKVFFEHDEGTDGVSNAVTLYISLPIEAATITNATWGGMCSLAVDNSAVLTTPARWSIGSGSDTILTTKDAATTAWTASGGKRVRIHGWYEIQ